MYEYEDFAEDNEGIYEPHEMLERYEDWLKSQADLRRAE